MPEATIAQEVVEAVGGARNVLASTVCMTRLRMTVRDMAAVATDRLTQIQGVLGVLGRGERGLEVVFGPAMVDGVYRQFRRIVGEREDEVAPGPDAQAGGESAMRVVISPGRRSSYAAQAAAAAPSPEPAAPEGADGAATPLPGEDLTLDELYELLDAPTAGPAAAGESHEAAPGGAAPRLLVLNGPNINMLGVREPDVYGSETYADLVATCERAAREAGFSACRCYQSNHEGDLVDQIQQALGRYDAIVINPAAYTHTSVAILDALKAVCIPAVEVHISKVEEREDFRQVSYVRAACLETVTGMGLAGYARAIADLAAHLRVDGDE